MSCTARRHRKTERRRCTCGRRARYYSRARRGWRWMPDHPLCTACYRSELNAHEARMLAYRLWQRSRTRRVVAGTKAA